MRKKTRLSLIAVLPLVFGGMVPILNGCELIASVDRSKISGSTCTSDLECSGGAPVCDTSAGVCVECVANTDCSQGKVCNSAQTCVDEGAVADASSSDADLDSGIDATVDSGSDATLDSGVDATADSGPDATLDSGSDAATDSDTDATPDGGSSCSDDTECPNSDCECGLSSGQCGGTGQCGAGKARFTIPTSDGTTSSGTFTVPAGCATVFIQAWGAGGGSGGQSGDFSYQAGGAGGYVGGTLSVSPGDVFTAWIGQGGALGTTSPGGTPGIGSYAGTAAKGGSADGDGVSNPAGGVGGGLTSVTLTGSTSITFSVPGGGGAGATITGGHGGGTGSGGEASQSGGNAAASTQAGGGGAGENGGAGGASTNQPGAGGAFGTLPSGLTSAVGSSSVAGSDPAHATAFDLGFCNAGGAGQSSFTNGGDGCIAIRCVAP